MLKAKESSGLQRESVQGNGAEQSKKNQTGSFLAHIFLKKVKEESLEAILKLQNRIQEEEKISQNLITKNSQLSEGKLKYLT